MNPFATLIAMSLLVVGCGSAVGAAQLYFTAEPAHIRGGIVRYIDEGIAPGSFLTAIICNDLIGACGKADGINRLALFDIVAWFWNESPSSCWKSREAMDAWIAKHRKVEP